MIFVAIFVPTSNPDGADLSRNRCETLLFRSLRATAQVHCPNEDNVAVMIEIGRTAA
jgi:hypothetical protein